MSTQTLTEKLTRHYKYWQFNAKRQHAFLEDLAVLIEDGVAANRAIEMLEKIYTGINKEAAGDISQAIAAGKTLTEATEPWFNLNIVELIRVGEESGLLADSLRNAAEFLAKKAGTLSAVIAALVYPLTVIIAGCVVVVYINHSVFVDFKAIKPVSEWPGIGQELISLANFIEHWYFIVVLAIIAIIFGLRYLMVNYIGAYRNELDKLPAFSLYRKLTAAKLMENIGLLISNGVVFKKALAIAQRNASPYLLSHLIKMEHLLATGKDNIADVLDTGLINKEDILRLQVVAEAKGFEHALVRLGRYASKKGENTIRFSAKVSGWVLLGLGAGMIVFMVFAIYSVGMSLGSV